MQHRLAIHPNERSFAGRWIEWCVQENVSHKIVDCYQSNIIEQLKDCTALAWHIGGVSKDLLMGRGLLYSLEIAGVPVFPNFRTSFHFDDKVAQKYLLEAIDAPLVETWVFYDQSEALRWAQQASFPKVFKLRGGSGSRNVRLVKDRSMAIGLIKKAFRRGFAPGGMVTQEAWKLAAARKRGDLSRFLSDIPAKLAQRSNLKRLAGREIGYAYFQEFVPGNSYDIRITVIGKRAFAFTRDVRPNDFRASGSGRICYDISRIPHSFVQLAFEIARKIEAQSIAFDFLQDSHGVPLVNEISFGYAPSAVHECPGRFDSHLRWIEGRMWPEHAILEDLLGMQPS